MEVEARLAFMNDADVACGEVFAAKIDAVGSSVFFKSVNVGPFLTVDGGLEDGVDDAGELAGTCDDDDTGEVSVVAELDGGGGGGSIGVKVTSVFFDDTPVAGGIVPAVSGFLNAEGAAGAEEDAGKFFRSDVAFIEDAGGEFADGLESGFVTIGGSLG